MEGLFKFQIAAPSTTGTPLQVIPKTLFVHVPICVPRAFRTHAMHALQCLLEFFIPTEECLASKIVASASALTM